MGFTFSEGLRYTVLIVYRGWDWGPILNTCGPWRSVRLETYQSRVSDLRIDYELDDSFKTASGTITAKVEGASGKTVGFEVRSDEGLVFEESAAVSEGVATVQFHVKDPKLWFPHGYGEQPLYKVTATVSADGVNLHQATRRIGFRKGELVQQPDEIGKTFFFRVNGVDVFCGGSDWIPADSFTPRVSEERYRKWLEMMVDGYQIMIRYGAPAHLRVSLRNPTPQHKLTEHLGFGVEAFGRRTSSTTYAMNWESWCGRISCLGAATTQPFPRSSNRYARNASQTSADYGTTLRSSYTLATTKTTKCRSNSG